MNCSVRLGLIGVFALGCSPNVQVFLSNGGSSGMGDGADNGGTGSAAHAGRSGDGTAHSGSSNTGDAGAGGSAEEQGGSMSVSGGSSLGGAGTSGSSSTAGAAGLSGSTATGGAAGTGGTSTSGNAGAAGTSGTAGSSGSGGALNNAITHALPSAGCGLNPDSAFVPGTTAEAHIQTSSTKATGCADSVCGAWAYERDYYVTLPVGYDKTKAYPLVFEATTCGGIGADVYPLSDSSNVDNAGNTVIRVGLTPPPNTIGHSTHPGQGCFDSNEGDDSVDFVFYETLYDKLASGLCVDRNRVFAAGHSNGGDLANELGCKYAGDATRPIRGVLSNTGVLPTEPAYTPTCSTKPMAGMWIGATGDATAPFSGTVIAINRAIAVNGCTGGDYAVTPMANYPVGGANSDSTCKRITGCPALYPLVVCALVSNQHSSNSTTANPGFSTFLKAFETTPLFTP